MTFTPLTIRVIDLETTGFPPDAEVIEIAAVDVVVRPFHLSQIKDRAATSWVGRMWAARLFQTLLPTPSLVRPVRAIPSTASAIHHLIDEDVTGAPLWADVWPRFLTPAIDVYAAHTKKFEQAFITDAMTGGKPWICTHKCALRIWPEAPSHSNQALRYWLKPPGLDRSKAALAHRALPDAYVTAHLLSLLLERATTQSLIEWSAQPALLPRVPFGRSRGQSWRDVDDGFLEWVLARDFDEDVIFTAKTEMERREKERKEAGVPDADDDDDEWGEGDE